MKQLHKLQIGKKGLTAEFITQLKTYFDSTGARLVKVDILKSACRDKEEAKEIGEKLIKELGDNYTYKLIGYVLTIKRWRRSKIAGD